MPNETPAASVGPKQARLIDDADAAYLIGEADAASAAGAGSGGERSLEPPGLSALALRRDADRAVQRAVLPPWETLVVECERGVLAMAPVSRSNGSVAVLCTSGETAPERARREVSRLAARATAGFRAR